MKLQPLGDRVLVKPLEPKEVKKGGIIIPDTAKEKPQEGEVIAVGPGKKNDEGKVMPMNVKVKDKILFGKYSGTEVKIESEDYLIMNEDDIYAVIQG
ncbi:MAG: co-chaperone GroES [Endomicrobiia bacterium]|nr:co-chaperone GroES [Endomicrobiia bacterium]